MPRLSTALYNYVHYLEEYSTSFFTRHLQDGHQEHVFVFTDGTRITISKYMHTLFVRQRDMGRA